MEGGHGQMEKVKPRAMNTKKQSKPMHTKSGNMGKETMMDPPSIEHMKSGNSTEEVIETVTVDEPSKSEPQIENEDLEEFENPTSNTSSVILHFSFYWFLNPKNQQKPTKTRKPGNLET
jgi:hypothetical protein